MVKIKEEIQDKVFQVSVNDREYADECIKKINYDAEAIFKNFIYFIASIDHTFSLEIESPHLTTFGNLLDFSG